MTRKKISKKEIERRSLEALKSQGFANIVPVPVDIMIERIGADIIPRKNMLQRIGIDALWNQDFTELHIDEYRYMSSSNHRGRFTLAHEIGHYYLHRNHRKIFKDTNEWKEHILGKTPLRRIEELEANNFGGFLLIPTKALSHKFQELKENDTTYRDVFGEDISNRELMEYFISDLARHFEVSTYCMEIRIKYFNEY